MLRKLDDDHPLETDGALSANGLREKAGFWGALGVEMDVGFTNRLIRDDIQLAGMTKPTNNANLMLR